jgi:Gram-negative bacterial TonB protein C-terminal
MKESSGMSAPRIERTGKRVPCRVREAFRETRSVHLFVRSESPLTNCVECLSVLATRVAGRSYFPANHFLRATSVAHPQFAGRPMGASFLLHCSLLAVLIYLPQAIPAKASAISESASAYRIYYRVPLLTTAKMPVIAPKGPGGRAGSGSNPLSLPQLGSSAVHPNMTIVSNPARPDNFRQTIYQPSSPPELKIATEQKVPNIVLGHVLDAPKAPLSPNESRPAAANRRAGTVEAPSVSTESHPADPLMTFLKPTEVHPQLAIPAGNGGGPIQRSQSASAGSSGGASAEGARLIALGVDPAAPGTEVSLPGGNRWGQFSVAPPSGSYGSPGGDPKGDIGGGAGDHGSGLGGDTSTGVGSGGSGGGGGNSGTLGPVSVTGSGTSGSAVGVLDASLAESMVYPVAASAIRVRKNTLIIAAGPAGGGSLNAYGALKCGKIYSIFLTMPGKNWSLQYCDESATVPNQSTESGTTFVQMDQAIMPPDFDPDQRFDFKRVAVPAEKAHRSIILKGVIDDKGAVQHLVVYQGVSAEMDEAARIAFTRWHFKPAMKGGKPIEVQILVGIPPASGEDRVNR